MADDLDGAIARARAVGEAKDRLGQRATGAWYDMNTGRVFVSLVNGMEFSFPAHSAQGLRDASAEDLAEVRVMPGGSAVQWDRLDAGFTVDGLVAGRFGTERWMQSLAQEQDWVRAIAAEMGRKGGSATSAVKAEAARKNGLKGGRPRTPRSEASGVVLHGADGRISGQPARTASPGKAASQGEPRNQAKSQKRSSDGPSSKAESSKPGDRSNPEKSPGKK